MAIAIFKTGGKQYKVSVGDRIDVEKLEAAVGDTATFDQVLFFEDNGDIRIGDPLLNGAKVTAKVLDQARAKKVIAFKYKRRKGYHRTIGHRRQITKLQIEAITP